MTVGEADDYLSSPLYKEAVQNCQLGNWETALAQINELVKTFPWRTSCARYARRCSCAPGSIRMKSKIITRKKGGG